MKTSLKRLLTATLTVFVLSATVLHSTAEAKVKKLTMSATKVDIKKVIVTGNTKVILVQSSKEWVALEDDMMDKVAIRQEGDILRISSAEETPVTVVVYVKNPYRVDASNTSTVDTRGNFKLKYLQLILKDSAKACIKATTESLYTAINDQSKLELLGTTQSHFIKTGGIASLKMNEFAALETTREVSGDTMALNNANAMNTKKVAIDSLRNKLK